jgi:hypothetical protein
MYKTLLVTLIASALSTGTAVSAPAARKEPLDAATKRVEGDCQNISCRALKSCLLANSISLPNFDLIALRGAIQSEGNWAGFWGNEAIDKKLHDIGSSGPVVLDPDYSKLRVVGLTRDVAESYVPMNITVSYAGQDGTARPFLMIINWLRVGKDWKVASEIILPVPPAPAAKG